MKIISHRGNLEGPEAYLENSIGQIEKCFDLDLECEVDLRLRDGKLFLGHDYAQYEISIDWLVKNSSLLWIHCKDSESLSFLKKTKADLNYFWHENDKHTITSKGFFWNYPGGPITQDAISVLPENWWKPSIHQPLTYALGICTDFPTRFRKKLNLV